VSKGAAGWLVLASGMTLGLLLQGSSAEAALGEGLASVASDRARIGGALKSTTAAGYAVHELDTPAGTAVRQFAGADGTVFAVAWQGPFLPDLRTLLGAYFQPYAQAARAKRSRRGPLHLEVGGLVVESSGHMRSFRGRAYLSDRLPEGVTLDAIR
jgi:Protein of unknown function (DUF2844)